MTYSEIAFFVLALIVMVIGLIGTIVPVLPGLPLIWFAALCYALLTDFQTISMQFLLLWALVVIVILTLQYLMTIYGAKRLGASRWGTVGAAIGTIVGIFTLTLWGIILGPLVGAVGFELIGGNSFGQALKAGIGTFLGFVFGTISQIIASMALMGMFVYYALF